MASNLDQRLYRLEKDLQRIAEQIAQILARLAAVEQKQWQPDASMGGGGGSSNFYVAFPTATVAAATWAAGVPTAGVSFSAVVCQVSSSGISNLGSQTCYNWLASSLAANKGCIVEPDGTGSYGVVSQSCT